MEPRLWSPPRTYIMLALALPVAIACGSSGDGGDQPKSPVGQQMGQIGDLGDEFVKQNAQAYAGLEHAAQYVATAFAGSGASPSVVDKGGGEQGCLPAEYTGATLAFDSPSSSYVATTFPGAPSNGVRFLIYETNNGTATENDIGTVDVSCTGIFPSVNVTVIVTVDDVVLLNLLASNAFFAPGSFGAGLSGFISNANGSNQIQFGQLGGFISVTEFDSSQTLDFDIGGGVFAFISHSKQLDAGFGGYESGFVNVYREMGFTRLFDYNANLDNMGEGDMVGGGLFYAEDGFNFFVNCFKGTIDNMVVSAAGPSCAPEYFDIDPTPLPPGDIAAIQSASDALFGMFNAVAGVAEVGGQVGIAIAESQAQQF
jgi:hypothetical protein